MVEQLPYPPEWHKLAADNVRAHAELLSLIREARQKGAVAWPNPPTLPFSDWMRKGSLTGGRSGQRVIANIVADAALYAHFQGDDAEAIARLQDLGFLADATNQQPFLVAKLVGVGVMAVQAHSVQVISTHLSIAGARKPLQDAANKPASREAAKALMAALLDDEPVMDAYRWTLREERTILIEETRGGAYAGVPQAHVELLQNIKAYDDMISAIDRPSWEATKINAGFTLQTVVPSMERYRQSRLESDPHSAHRRSVARGRDVPQ